MIAQRKKAGRDVQAAMRREQLLSSALTLFCEHGYAGTSTRKIAEAAGVTEGLVFHYFPTKEALLLAIAARQQTFAGRVLIVVQQAGDRSARELLSEIADGLSSVTAEEMAFIGFMYAESQVNPTLRAMVVGANAMVQDSFIAMLGKRMETGELRAEASLSAAAAGFFGGFFFFFTQHRHLDPQAWRREASAFAKAWADQCWRGLATTRARSRSSAARAGLRGRP